MVDYNKIPEISHNWEVDPRWQGVTRDYAAEDVLRLRGSVEVQHTLATLHRDRSPRRGSHRCTPAGQIGGARSPLEHACDAEETRLVEGAALKLDAQRQRAAIDLGQPARQRDGTGADDVRVDGVQAPNTTCVSRG